LVADAGKLRTRAAEWLRNTDARDATADAALSTVEGLAGAYERTLAALDPYLLQLRFQYR
jgi:3-deoxy-D-manno-octulosonic-acid transferase